MSSKRLNYYLAAPQAMKAMIGLEKAASESILPGSLRELVRIRASQINGCAYCIDMHTADATKAGESVRRLMAVSAWKETPSLVAWLLSDGKEALVQPVKLKK